MRFEVDFQDVIDEFGVTPQRLSNLARGSRNFSQKTQRGDEYVVKADVYESGELDELGQVVPDDPATGRSYLDPGPSCE